MTDILSSLNSFVLFVLSSPTFTDGLVPFLTVGLLQPEPSSDTPSSLVSRRSSAGEEKKETLSGPPERLCQRHLSAAASPCFLLRSSQHAAWLHKTRSAGECPTAGRPRLRQFCCVSPTRVPPPAVPDSPRQLAAHLCLCLLLQLREHRWTVWEKCLL